MTLKENILGKVQCCNFFSLLNLLLVRLDFALKLVNQGLHPLVVLLVLILLVDKLFDPTLRLPEKH